MDKVRIGMIGSAGAEQVADGRRARGANLGGFPALVAQYKGRIV